MHPRPDYQRRQAHRQRLALGRALHQVRAIRWKGRKHAPRRLYVPKMLRKHTALLRRTFAVLGS